MTAAERRKDPQKVRAMLLQQTATLIAEQGLGRVTVDAVARASGVTKGGLFHHFPSKQALIDGVVDDMIAEADATIDQAMADDPEPHGSFTRAFLDGVFADRRNPEGCPSSRTMCLAMLADPLLQQRWAAWFASRVARHTDTDGDVSCAVAQLAADGIWLSSLHDGDAPPPVDPAVRDRLYAMTRGSP